MPEPVEILLADDSDVGRYVIATALRRAGFAIREVSDGLDALREAVQRPPDLAILDVKMPGLDGMETCRRLKADPATSFVPILLLSATFLDTADQVEGLDIGADAYLTQPVETPVLIASINSLLRARTAERAERRIATEWQVTFDSIGDAVALVDPLGAVRRCNRAFAALAHVRAEDAVGERLEGLLPSLAGRPTDALGTELAIEIGERQLTCRVDELPDPESAGHVVLTLRDVTAEIELARERERVFRREQLISTTLQEALVPRLLPTITGLQLHAKYAVGEADVAVGGDWFDAIQTPHGVWLAIGDMTGHGVSAAAQAVQLRHNLRLLAEEGYGPAEAMSRLGALLAEGELVETATAAIAAFDRALATVLIVCGGHPPVLHIGADGVIRRLEEAHGPMLGYPGGRHEAVPLSMAPGDTLVLYTDGLVERRGESIDAGIARLEDTLVGVASSDAAEHAFNTLLPHAPTDDAAILIAHRVRQYDLDAESASSQTSVDPSVSEWPG